MASELVRILKLINTLVGQKFYPFMVSMHGCNGVKTRLAACDTEVNGNPENSSPLNQRGRGRRGIAPCAEADNLIKPVWPLHISPAVRRLFGEFQLAS